MDDQLIRREGDARRLVSGGRLVRPRCRRQRQHEDLRRVGRLRPGRRERPRVALVQQHHVPGQEAERADIQSRRLHGENCTAPPLDDTSQPRPVRVARRGQEALRVGARNRSNSSSSTERTIASTEITTSSTASCARVCGGPPRLPDADPADPRGHQSTLPRVLSPRSAPSTQNQ